MLLADNQPLADALASGQTIRTAYRLEVDWNRDGTYSGDYSNFSGNVNDVTMDAQATGNYPAEVDVTDGYAQRRFTVTIGGVIGPDSVPVDIFFSPYAQYYPGTVGYVNTPCRFYHIVQTANGPVEIPQGEVLFMLLATPNHGTGDDGGTVELELGDITSQLTAGVDYLPTARSQVWAQWGQFTDAKNTAIRNRGGSLLSWYIMDLCRRNGLYQSPPAPPNCVAYWTFAGGPLPEIGGMWQTPADERQGNQYDNINLQIYRNNSAYYENQFLPDYSNSYEDATSIGYYPWSPSLDSPSALPSECWERGPFGPRMKIDGYDTNETYYGTVSDYMQFIGHTVSPIFINATGSNTSRVYWGGWQVFKNCDSNNYVGIITNLGGASNGYYPDYSNGSDARRYYECTVQVLLNTGQFALDIFHRGVRYGIYPNGGSAHWSALCPVLVPRDGNSHYLGVCLEQVGNAMPKFYFNIDGVEYPVTPDYDQNNDSSLPVNGTMRVIDSSCYMRMDGNRNVEASMCAISSWGGSNNWGIWTEGVGPASRPRQWSNTIPYTVGTDISVSSARAMYTPSIRNTASWELIKLIGSSDLGAVYVDEHGTLIYTNRSEIEAARKASAATANLTLDSLLSALQPYTSFDSVRTVITMQTLDKYFVDQAVYTSDDVAKYSVPGGAQQVRFTTQASGEIMSAMSLGGKDAAGVSAFAIPNRVYAQGAYVPNDRVSANILPTKQITTGNGSSSITTTAFDQQKIMQQFNPPFWRNGMTAHNLGDQFADGLPLPGNGVKVESAIGWGVGDRDPSRFTILLSSANVNGRTSLISVDDSTPFLSIRGYAVVSGDTTTTTVTTSDTAALAQYGQRQLDRPASDWSNDYTTQLPLTQALIDELATPRPVIQGLDVVMDPRRQLFDVISLIDRKGMGGPIYASIVGINRKYKDGVDSLTLRTFGPKGAGWILGDSDLSVLGQTTILTEE